MNTVDRIGLSIILAILVFLSIQLDIMNDRLDITNSLIEVDMIEYCDEVSSINMEDTNEDNN